MQTSATPGPAVVITGASTGIGAACALEMDRRGWRVFAGVRVAADGQRLLEQASPRLTPVRIDVSDQESVAGAAERVAAAVGAAGLAGLVNNAGIAVAGPLELLPLDLVRRQLEVNVIGQVAVTQAMIPLLRAGRGRIVNISSISGLVGAPYLGPYAASKHALEALSDALRVELRAWGIAVSVVEPGNVKTPIWQKAQDQARDLLRDLPAQAESLYGPDIAAMQQATARMAAGGMPVWRVVRAVVHALTARRPKTRYPVGLQTRLAACFWPLLGDRMRDWIMRRELGLR